MLNLLQWNNFKNIFLVYSRIPENIESYVARLETLGKLFLSIII
jgi:hypothetical protein